MHLRVDCWYCTPSLEIEILDVPADCVAFLAADTTDVLAADATDVLYTVKAAGLKSPLKLNGRPKTDTRRTKPNIPGVAADLARFASCLND